MRTAEKAAATIHDISPFWAQTHIHVCGIVSWHARASRYRYRYLKFNKNVTKEQGLINSKETSWENQFKSFNPSFWKTSTMLAFLLLALSLLYLDASSLQGLDRNDCDCTVGY